MKHVRKRVSPKDKMIVHLKLYNTPSKYFKGVSYIRCQNVMSTSVSIENKLEMYGNNY